MTFKLIYDLAILKPYLHTKYELSRIRSIRAKAGKQVIYIYTQTKVPRCNYIYSVFDVTPRMGYVQINQRLLELHVVC